MKYPTPLQCGPAIEKAPGAIVLVHGRGASAAGMLDLLEPLRAASLCALAPQAPGHTWYPLSFLAPLEANQPYLDAALAHLDSVVSDLIARKMPPERIALLGFSQGACLISELVARHPTRYGAIMALSGGLIGPPGTPRKYPGTLAGAPVFLAGSDPDPHVPFARVRESAEVFTAMGAVVDLRHYPGMDHTINDEEIDACRKLLAPLSQPRTVTR